MKIAMVHGPNDLRLDEISEPQPGPDDVLVRVAACGICGSDLSYVAMGGLAVPMPLGHELSGVVERAGARVTGVGPGQHVVVNPMAGGNNIGNGGPEGGLAPLLVVRGGAPGAVLPIPAHVPFARAALAEPLAVALHAVNRAAVSATDRVVVFGAGPIGLGIIYWLKRRGVAEVVAVDLSAKRLDLAARFGAAATVNPRERGVGQALAERHGSGTLFGWPVVESDIYIDAAGAPTVIGEAINLARAGARLVVVALHKEPVAVDFRLVLAKELTIAAAIGYPTEFPEVIAALATAGDTLDALISHRVEWPALARAFTAAQDPATALKVMVTFPV